MTMAAMADGEYGNYSQGANIYYPEESEQKRGEYPWQGVPVGDWRAEVSRITGVHFLFPYGMFGILSMENRRYIGDSESELRCGGSSGISTVAGICVPVERCDAAQNEDGDKDIRRRRLKSAG